MSYQFQNRRPFSRWHLKPKLAEPSYSYFARLVADEGEASVRQYAESVGINGRNMIPTDILGVLKRLPLAEPHIKNLTLSTPIRTGNFYEVNHQSLRHRQFSHRYRRYCAQCLAESPYHRVYWDVVSFVVCPKHATQIQEDVNGKKLGWWYSDLERSPSGDVLSKKATTDEDFAAHYPFHSMIMNRLTPGYAKDDPLADKALWEVIEASSEIAAMIQSPVLHRRAASPDPEYGYALLVSGPDAILEAFRDWFLRAMPEEHRRVMSAHSINSLSGAWSTKNGNSLGPFVRDMMINAFSSVGKLRRKRKSISVDGRHDRTLSQTAQELGVDYRALSKLIRSQNLLPNARWDHQTHYIDEKAFQNIKDTLDDLMPLNKTFPLTGIPAHEFRLLAKDGLITEHVGLSRNSSKSPHYSRRRIIELVEAAWAACEGADAGKTFSLFGYARRHQIKQGDVLIQVFRGKIKPVGLDKEANGFRKLRFTA